MSNYTSNFFSAPSSTRGCRFSLPACLSVIFSLSNSYLSIRDIPPMEMSVAFYFVPVVPMKEKLAQKLIINLLLLSFPSSFSFLFFFLEIGFLERFYSLELFLPFLSFPFSNTAIYTILRSSAVIYVIDETTSPVSQ